MHELSIAEEILTTAKTHIHSGRRLLKVNVALGPFSGVERESLEFCFALAANHFGLEGAALIVEQLTAEGTCSSCDKTGTVADMWSPCAHCGYTPMTVEGGRELRITQLEIEEEEDV